MDRDGELAQLDQVLADLGERSDLALLTGLGGVGKSALALRWGHRNSDAFPDGQLYADLSAAGPTGPRAPVEVLGWFLRALGVPPQAVPADEGEQSGLWRTLTAGRRLFILLDNAASATQVRPLLPTSCGCLVVVTSRTQLEGLVPDGARVTSVHPLPEPAAIDLLAQTVGERRVADEQAAARSLVRMCGGMPIALTVVAARLATHPHRRISRLANDLARERKRMDRLSIGDISVTAAFDVAYRGLSAPAARGYRLMVGVHPGQEFAAPLAAAALGVDQEEASAVLDELEIGNLLTHVAEDRYRFHDLVAVHARQLAQRDPERQQARQRILAWYLAGTRMADQILTPYRRRPHITMPELPPDAGMVLVGRDQALDWIEAERTNLVATVQSMADTFPELVYLLADAMWPLFHLGRHHPDRMLVDAIALKCARRIGNPAFEAAALRRWGFAHYDIGRLDDAHSLFQDSLAIAARIDGLDHIRAAAYAGLGLVALASHDPQTAIRHFTHSLDTCTRTHDTRGIGLAQLRLGSAHRRAGQHGAAIEHLTHAQTILDGLAGIDPYNAARARIELGRALAGDGQTQNGFAQIERGLDEMTALRSPRGRAEALHALGELTAAAGAVTEAVYYLTEAKDLFEAHGDTEAADVRRLIDQIERTTGG